MNYELVEKKADIKERAFRFALEILKMNIAKKEARETMYWIRLIKASEIVKDLNLQSLLQENEEILKILTSIVKTSEETHNS